MIDTQRPFYPLAIADRVLVRPLDVETTVRGMARPGAQDERPREGLVVLVGPGRVTEWGHRVRPEVSAGDLVAFPDYAGKEIVDPRGFVPGKYLLMRQDEIQLNYGPAAGNAGDDEKSQ